MTKSLADARVELFWLGAEHAREFVAEFGWDAAYGRYATVSSLAPFLLVNGGEYDLGFKAHLDATLEREATLNA
jgi:hypothetical protein